MEKDSIEKIVCEAMDKLDRVPVSKKNMELLSRLSMLQGRQLNIPKEERPFKYLEIANRIEHCLTAKLEDDKLILFLSAISISVDEAIMYLYYIQWRCKKNNERHLTLEGLGMRIFPKGFFRSEDLNKIWRKQKTTTTTTNLGTDNMIDVPYCSESIQFD